MLNRDATHEGQNQQTVMCCIGLALFVALTEKQITLAHDYICCYGKCSQIWSLHDYPSFWSSGEQKEIFLKSEHSYVGHCDSMPVMVYECKEEQQLNIWNIVLYKFAESKFYPFPDSIGDETYNFMNEDSFS
jgi:alanyl-tRNA synthetase